MFGRVLYLSDNIAYIENKLNDNLNGDLLNYHLIFESDTQKVLGEINEVKESHIEVRFLGEFINGKYYNGITKKVNLNCKIRIINSEELVELIGKEEFGRFELGKSTTYKDFIIYPKINDLFSSHMCIFGNSGSGKSCGTARLIQNILNNSQSLAYNANLIFFDSFGEYKTAFNRINTINEFYNYKYITTNPLESTDEIIQIPVNLLTLDDYAILLQADKHSQLTILDMALKYARLFSIKSDDVIKYKNNIIAKALLEILYSSNTAKQKKDEIFSIIKVCNTPDFSFDTPLQGVGFSRTFSECFIIDSHGNFGEEVLVNEHILKFIDNTLDEFEVPEDACFTLDDYYKALEFTLISEGFNQNKNIHDDAQLLKVRLHNILNNQIGTYFTGDKNISKNEFINYLLTKNNTKAQIININLEGIDDMYAKALIKIFSHLLFEFAKTNTNRGTIPFHLFIEEAHRYIQNDNDVYILGYNIFQRIAKEGRKFGIILNIISQRPVSIDETIISQCSNFLIFKMTHALDIKYISEMLPNISQDIVEKVKTLQPGMCVAFGSAFKIPFICKLDMPDPAPASSSCDVANLWDSKGKIETEEVTANGVKVNVANLN